jgi:predicted regulator of Ras-like GTPase activity (Roadblock/LC7/MglB family)
MSAVKYKFVGLLRRLLHLSDEREMNGLDLARPPGEMPPVLIVATGRPAAMPAQVPVPPPTLANPDRIQLALQPILAALPMELSGKVVTSDTAAVEISIPLDKVLPQLATGLVKISYGELRQLAPGVFAETGTEQDAKSVILPLDQLLPRISPALLARRAAQKQLGIAEEIANPFSREGQNLNVSSETGNPAALAPASPPKNSTSSASDTTPLPALNPRWKTPAVNGARLGRTNGNGKPVARGSNGSTTPAGLDIPSEAADPRAEVPAPTGLHKPILVPLSALSECWPGALRVEIEMLNLAQAQVALPANLIEPALKRGRVVFTWRDLRSWIQNIPVPVSVHDNIKLDLPLKVLAPLFFARPKNGTTAKKVTAAEEIPNLFFDLQQPASARPATPREPAVPPPAAVVPVRAPALQPTEPVIKRPGNSESSSRAVTPADLVSRAIGLPGVAGAVIALPDGLKVASRIPVGLNSDTLAAFLPQIFTRVNQSSRELHLGEVNNLCFTVGRVPWNIFRVNAAYFAAFGHANESLPTAQLAALASELEHTKQ